MLFFFKKQAISPFCTIRLHNSQFVQFRLVHLKNSKITIFNPIHWEKRVYQISATSVGVRSKSLVFCLIWHGFCRVLSSKLCSLKIRQFLITHQTKMSVCSIILGAGVRRGAEGAPKGIWTTQVRKFVGTSRPWRQFWRQKYHPMKDACVYSSIREEVRGEKHLESAARENDKHNFEELTPRVSIWCVSSVSWRKKVTAFQRYLISFGKLHFY